MYQLLGLHPSIAASHDHLLAALHPADRHPELLTPARSHNGSAHIRDVRIQHPDFGYRPYTSATRYLDGAESTPRRQIGLIFSTPADPQAELFGQHLLTRFGYHAGPDTSGERPAIAGRPVDLPSDQLLTPHLVSAARALLDWTMQDLAKASGLSFSTIRRVEDPLHPGVNPAMELTVRRTLEQHGLRFLQLGDSIGFVGPATTAPAAMG